MEFGKFSNSEPFEHEEPIEFSFRMFMHKTICEYMVGCKSDFRSFYDSEEEMISPGVNKRMTTAIIVWLLPSSVLLTSKIRKFCIFVGDTLSEIGEKLSASRNRLKEEHQRTIDLFNATSPDCLSENASQVEEDNYNKNKDEEAQWHYNIACQKFTEATKRYVNIIENYTEIIKEELEEKSEILARISAAIAVGYCELEKKTCTPEYFDSVQNMLNHLIDTAKEKTELSIRLQKELLKHAEVADPLDAPPTAPECPICLGKYSDQRKMMFLTPCQHAVCVDCLSKTVERKECAVCRSKWERASIVYF